MFRVSLMALILLMLVAYVATKYVYWDSSSDQDTLLQEPDKHDLPGDKTAASIYSEATLSKSTEHVQNDPYPEWATLEKWVYDGDDAQRSEALNYLEEFPLKGLPLILYLIYSDADLTVKERAVITLSTLPAEIGEPVLFSLLKVPELKDSVIALTGFTLHSNTTLDQQGDEELTHDSLADLRRDLETLASFSVEQAGSTVERGMRHNMPDDVQMQAYNAAMGVLPERAQHWQSLALQNGKEQLLLQVISELDINDRPSALLPQLLRLVYGDNPQSVKGAVATYLSESSPGVDLLPKDRG